MWDHKRIDNITYHEWLVGEAMKSLVLTAGKGPGWQKRVAEQALQMADILIEESYKPRPKSLSGRAAKGELQILEIPREDLPPIVTGRKTAIIKMGVIDYEPGKAEVKISTAGIIEEGRTPQEVAPLVLNIYRVVTTYIDGLTHSDAIACGSPNLRALLLKLNSRAEQSDDGWKVTVIYFSPPELEKKEELPSEPVLDDTAASDTYVPEESGYRLKMKEDGEEDGN